MSGSNEPGAPAAPTRPTKGAIATAVTILGLLAVLVWAIGPPRVNFTPAPLEPVTADCPRITRRFVPSNILEIRDPPLTGLTPEKRMRVLRRMNFEPCTCGCNSSIAECRLNNPHCEVSKRLAERIIAEVQEEPASAQ